MGLGVGVGVGEGVVSRAGVGLGVGVGVGDGVVSRAGVGVGVGVGFVVGARVGVDGVAVCAQPTVEARRRERNKEVTRRELIFIVLVPPD